MVSRTDTTISFAWESVECRHRNGEIIGYSVTYYIEEQSDRSMNVMVSNLMFTASALLFNKKYVFNVRAVNVVHGFGPPADINLTTAELQGEQNLFALQNIMLQQS